MWSSKDLPVILKIAKILGILSKKDIISHPDICYVLWPQTILPFIVDEYHYSAHYEISRISRPNNDLMGQNRDDRSGNSRDNSL